MDSDERQVCDYLKSWPRHFVSAREVARRAGGKRRFREDPQWAYSVLTRLLEQGFIESDGLGHYRMKAIEPESKKRKRWVSPHVRAILERSGKNVDHLLELPDDADPS